MDDTQAAEHAMAGWLGALGRAGLIQGQDATTSAVVAQYVVGEQGLASLREYLTTSTAVVRDRERKAAIEVCIWMMHADRKIDPEEVALLREIIERSGLSEDDQDELVQGTHEPPSLEGVEERITHPVLRELLLALSWELASIDGNVAKAERDFYTGLSKRLGVSAVRAAEIQRAIAERVG
jgi:tellurite resistance protein